MYSKALRFAWHRYNNGGHFDIKKSEFRTLLQKKFPLNNRMANSVIHEIQGTYNALRELKWHQFSQLKIKVKKLYKKREKLEKKVFVLKEKVIFQIKWLFIRIMVQNIYFVICIYRE